MFITLKRRILSLFDVLMAFSEKRPYWAFFILFVVSLWVPLLLFSIPFQADDFSAAAAVSFKSLDGQSAMQYLYMDFLDRLGRVYHSFRFLDFHSRHFFTYELLGFFYEGYFLVSKQLSENLALFIFFSVHFLNAILFYRVAHVLDPRFETRWLRISAVLLFIPLYFIPEMFSDIGIALRMISLTSMLLYILLKASLVKVKQKSAFFVYIPLSLFLMCCMFDFYESTVFVLFLIFLFRRSFLSSFYAKVSYVCDFLMLFFLSFLKLFFFDLSQIPLSSQGNFFLSGMTHFFLYVFSFFVSNFHGFYLWGTFPILFFLLYAFYLFISRFINNASFGSFSFLQHLMLFVLGYVFFLSFLIAHYAPRGLYVVAPFVFLCLVYFISDAMGSLSKVKGGVLGLLFFSVLNIYSNYFYQNQVSGLYRDMTYFVNQSSFSSASVISLSIEALRGVSILELEDPDLRARAFKSIYRLSFLPSVSLSYLEAPTNLYSGFFPVVKQRLKTQFKSVSYHVFLDQ